MDSSQPLVEALAQTIVGEVRDDEATLQAFSTDNSLFSVRPSVAVFPRDARDVEKLVSLVSERRKTGEHISLTGRSAGTDMSGGPLTESIVVSFTEHFSRIGTVGDGYAEVEPGVYYRDFERATLAKGLLLPCYTASRDLCTVGGMVANNSGGERSLAYGKTADYVESLQVVLADGSEHTLRRLSMSELAVEKQEPGFMGNIYRQMHKLVVDNSDLLAKAKPRVSKNSAGYALWDIFDKQRDTFDLTRLFVGAQGTLGLTTDIRFRLVRPKAHRRMLVISLKDLAHLPEVTARILRYQPETFESYDDHTFTIALKYLPSILRRALSGNLLLAGLRLLPAAWSIAFGGVPALVLLAEFTSDDALKAAEQVAAAEKSLGDLPVRTRVTSSAAEANAFLTIRRESFSLLRQHVRGMRTAPFIDDFVVPPAVLHDFFPELYAILNASHLTYTVAGHIGDGNFHIIPLMPLHDPNLARIIPEIADKVYSLVLRYGGSITGEHNDG
ncbi:MAG: FAD-binding oxidoreductase, partial [Patescibacteria group bacterium]